MLTIQHHCVPQSTFLLSPQTLVAITAMVFKVYGEGHMSLHGVYAYVAFTNTITQALALYALILFYHTTRHELAPIRPLAKVGEGLAWARVGVIDGRHGCRQPPGPALQPLSRPPGGCLKPPHPSCSQFVCIKAIVFFTFWQGVAISILAAVGAVNPTSSWNTYDARDVANGLQDFLVCIEMLVAAVAHAFVFSPRDYYTDTPPPNRGLLGNIREMLDWGDVWEDATRNVADYAQETQREVRKGCEKGDGEGVGGGARHWAVSKGGTGDERETAATVVQKKRQAHLATYSNADNELAPGVWQASGARGQGGRRDARDGHAGGTAQPGEDPFTALCDAGHYVVVLTFMANVSPMHPACQH